MGCCGSAAAGSRVKKGRNLRGRAKPLRAFTTSRLGSQINTTDAAPQQHTSTRMPSQYIPPPVDDESIWPPPEAAIPRRSTWDRFSQKFKEEPFVPIGILATVFALGAATSALQKGNRVQFNKMLRYRVAAQGVTVVAALGGSLFYQADRTKARELETTARNAKLEEALATDTTAAPVKV